MSVVRDAKAELSAGELFDTVGALAGEIPGVAPLRDDHGGLIHRWKDPRVNREAARAGIEAGRSRDVNILAAAIEVKRLSHLPGYERHPALQRAVVAPDDVVRIAIARPPTHQTRWRREAA